MISNHFSSTASRPDAEGAAAARSVVTDEDGVRARLITSVKSSAAEIVPPFISTTTRPSGFPGVLISTAFPPSSVQKIRVDLLVLYEFGVYVLSEP